MNKPLDDLYLEWLYSLVAQVKQTNPSKTYWSLLRQLYRKEFVWIIPNDDNRVEDGRDLRYEFIDVCEDVSEVPNDWLELSCSVLEMLIGLSRRLEFEAEGRTRDWFWDLMGNLELEKCHDAAYRAGYSQEAVDEILERVIWRTYSSTGLGGLFPLQNPHDDQRKVELWYQLSAYLLERL